MDDGRLLIITDLIKAGDHIVLTGEGNSKKPYIVNGVPVATGLLKAGTNAVLTGSGTSADPYVLSANATGLLKAGTNVTITGAGTTASPYVINVPNATRGKPVTLVLQRGFTSVLSGVPQVTKNPDGSATLSGGIAITGPFDPEESHQFSVLPAGYAPAVDYVFMAYASLGSTYGQAVAGVTINKTTGNLILNTPDAPAVEVKVSLDGLTFWPAST